MKRMEQQYPGHVIPKSTLIATYLGLVFLTALMVGISRIDVHALRVDWIDLNAFQGWIVMGIATVMGIITAMFLMGLRYEHKLLNLTIFLSNFVFLFIFVVFTWADTSFRGEIDPSFEKKIDWTSPVKTGTGTQSGH
jgi:caa(3)-type oxidase subunit IV